MSEFRSLLPPNATDTERKLEEALARSDGIPVGLETLWRSSTCPEAVLPWLAWAFSLDTWDGGWTEAAKRAAIGEAVFVHRMKGTRASLVAAFAGIGIDAEVSEWFEHGGPRNTFRLELGGANIFAAGFRLEESFYRTAHRIVETTKPVREHYAVRIGERFDARVAVSPAHHDHQRSCEALRPRVRPVAYPQGGRGARAPGAGARRDWRSGGGG